MKTIVSKTGDGELLIYKSDGKGGYINLIIDEYGDIELMHVAEDRSKTWNKTCASVDEAVEFFNKNKNLGCLKKCLNTCPNEPYNDICLNCGSGIVNINE